jgi:hypothetical protein
MQHGSSLRKTMETRVQPSASSPGESWGPASFLEPGRSGMRWHDGSVGVKFLGVTGTQTMTKLEKIEKEIATLGKEDLFKLADWLAEYQANLWDKQIEEDAKAGRLDQLIDNAKKEIAAGKVCPL